MKHVRNWMRYAVAGLLLVVSLGAAAAASDDPKDQDATAARALAERRQNMIDACERNRGTKEECAKQVETELEAERISRQPVQGGEGRRGGR